MIFCFLDNYCFKRKKKKKRRKEKEGGGESCQCVGQAYLGALGALELNVRTTMPSPSFHKQKTPSKKYIFMAAVGQLSSVGEEREGSRWACWNIRI